MGLLHSQLIQSSQRIVIKLGTQLVIDESGQLAESRLSSIAAQCAELHAAGKDIVVVSSGAVGLGKLSLQLKGSLSVVDKQACAAVGQSLLMQAWSKFFSNFSIGTAQILLTARDFSERRHYLHLRDSFERLLELRVVPIVNENDTVSTLELEEQGQSKSFGDNDKLAALVSGRLGAQLLIILTSVDGIFTDNPSVNPDAKLIPLIDGLDQLSAIKTRGTSAMGRGGMASKLEAARCAALTGVHSIIASGYRENVILELAAGSEVPVTLIQSKESVQGRKGWLGFASGYEGILIINQRAESALLEKYASLLPVGIVGVEGNFVARQVVSIQNESGLELGRGLVNYSVDEMRRIIGRKSQEIPQLLGLDKKSVAEEAVHRDNLVIFDEYAL